MASQEKIGDMTKRLYHGIAQALLNYATSYAGGRPSMHDPGSHSGKFVKETIEPILCSTLSPSDLPLDAVGKTLKDFDEVLVSTLDTDRLEFYERFQDEVKRFNKKTEDEYEALKIEQQRNGWKPIPSLESNQSALIQRMIDPLRSLVILMQSVFLPEDSITTLKLDNREGELVIQGAKDSSDLIYRRHRFDATRFTIEIKVEEALEALKRSTQWLYLVFDYLTKPGPIISKREEHIAVFGFHPKTEIPYVKPEKERKSIKSTHTTSPGTPLPSRKIYDTSLYKIGMQAMSYAKDSVEGACLLTNLLYNHILLQYVEEESAHHFHVFHLSTARPLTEGDISEVIRFYIYLVDRYMLRQHLFPSPSLLPLPADHENVQTSEATASGRLWLRIPSWVRSDHSLFRVMTGYLKTVFMFPVFLFMLRLIKPAFTMDCMESNRIVIYCEPVRRMHLTQFFQTGLIFRKRSRQGAILSHENGLFMVKVFAGAQEFSAEVSALTALAGVPGVPRLLGTGSTVAGNNFILMSNVGVSLSDEVTDDEAQTIWDTVLQPIHARGIHHHDIACHNITRDSNGTLHLIDFGESGPACASEADDCPDREWLEYHNVCM